MLTGQLGDVMQESAKTAISCIRSRSMSLGVTPEMFHKRMASTFMFLQAPFQKMAHRQEITMATAVVSALTGRPVRPDIAMTGEITLTGQCFAGWWNQRKNSGRKKSQYQSDYSA